MILQTIGKRFWPMLIIGIVIAFLLAMAVTFRLAGRGGGGVVDHDYYEKGRRYADESLRERNAERDGWHFSYARRGDHVLVTVADGKGRGIAGAQVRYLPAATDASREILLQEQGGGIYLLPAAAADTRGRLTVSRGEFCLQGRLAVVAQ